MKIISRRIVNKKKHRSNGAFLRMRGCFFKYRSDCRIFHDPCVANGSRGIVPKKFFLAHCPIVVYNCFINFRGKIMVKQLTKTEKVLFALLGLSVAIIVLGILFLLNAMQDMENPDNIAFFTAFSQIDNVLAKYIVVILTMSAGIMLFSNVALRFPNKKLRNGLTIGITTFAFVLTLPLVYVFIAILPLAAKATTTGMPAFDELFVVDQVMRTDNILKGFMAWFGNGAFLWVVLVFMLLLSILFLLEPLFAGICVTKGKILNIVGKNKDGKVRLFCTDELPVLKKQREEMENILNFDEDEQEGVPDELSSVVAPACDVVEE